MQKAPYCTKRDHCISNPNRKFSRYLSVFISGFLLILICILFSPNQVEGNSNTTYKHYIVQPGDTIWGIACSMINKDKVDPRDYIYAIQKINNVEDSVINPGDVLLLPVE